MLLKFAIKDFKDDRVFRQISKSTLTNYMGCLHEFHDYCIAHEIVDTHDITRQTLKEYLIYCQIERVNNATTINSKLRSLKIFFNYMEEIEVYTEKNNPGKKVDYVKADVRIEVFSNSQIQQMLSYYRRVKARNKNLYAYRDSTIIITLLATGIRKGELINLKWSDVDLDNRHIILFGKLRTQTSIPMADKLQKELVEYQLFCIRHFNKLPIYVFVTSEGKPMSAQAVNSVFRRLKLKMNFPNVRCCAYDFRHTFAHRFLMNGGDVFTLQKLMRHSSIEMTQRYLAIWGTALKEQNEKYNPLNNLDI